MNYELTMTPSGHLRLSLHEVDENPADDAWVTRLETSFGLSQASGIISLAAMRSDAPWPPVFSYWRDFAGLYLTRLCRTSEAAIVPLDPIEVPSESELIDFFLSAPPMRGGEYLDIDVLRELWTDLDLWARNAIANTEEGLSGWLREHAPRWRQVGRVCFHLAENKQDQEFPFAFLATYAPSLSKGGRVQYRPLGQALQEYAGKKNKGALINLLSPIQRASERIGFVAELVDSGDLYHPLAWTPSEAYRLLENVTSLEESGLLVRLPNWWRKRPRPRVSVTIGEKRQSLFGVDAMLDFEVGLAIGDEKLSEDEWREILSAGTGLVYVKGQWVEVDSEKLSQALEHWKSVESAAADEGISFIEGMRLLAGAPANLTEDGSFDNDDRGWSFVNAGGWLTEVLANLRNPEGLAVGVLSDQFRGTLRHYQEIGSNWLWFLSNLGLGACLADDMGLGKTVQVLSLLLSIKEQKAPQKPSLLVLPASLVANWRAEIGQFAPTLDAAYVHPSESDRETLSAMATDGGKAFEAVDVVLTTYGMLSRQEWLLDVTWHLVVLDEAQAIKNPSTRQTKIVKKLKADARIALTGTPVENRLSDLWSLFDFLSPGLLGSANRFKDFIKAMEAREHDRYAPLRNLVRPYILRRLKTDKSIISDLPDKTEMKAFCGLSKKQAGMYAGLVEELTAALAMTSTDGMKRRGLVLAYLMKFKQICNHPSQLLGDGIYSPAESGKFDRLAAICEEISSRQEKVLVFTQFREMTGPIADFLGGLFGCEGLVLHGGTAVKKRRVLIDLFQKETGPPFFVLSLKAGGTGLNLTEASHVIHFDRWWNPAVENQATDRAFRIGQHRNVVVHKFICRGTVEEKIDALIDEKTDLADALLASGGEAMLTEMSDEELLKAVALDIDRSQL